MNSYQLGRDIGAILARLQAVEKDLRDVRAKVGVVDNDNWYFIYRDDFGNENRSGPYDSIYACETAAADIQNATIVKDCYQVSRSRRRACMPTVASLIQEIERSAATCTVAVVRTQCDVEYAKTHGVKEPAIGDPKAVKPEMRVLHGNALINPAPGRYAWYSNADSSEICGISSFWTSGNVVSAVKTGTMCPDDCPGWEITVSD